MIIKLTAQLLYQHGEHEKNLKIKLDDVYST